MRQGWLFVPLVFILPHVVEIFGAQPIFGVQITQTASDLLSAAVAVPFMLNFFKKLGK